MRLLALALALIALAACTSPRDYVCASIELDGGGKPFCTSETGKLLVPP